MPLETIVLLENSKSEIDDIHYRLGKGSLSFNRSIKRGQLGILQIRHTELQTPGAYICMPTPQESLCERRHGMLFIWLFFSCSHLREEVWGEPAEDETGVVAEQGVPVVALVKLTVHLASVLLVDADERPVTRIALEKRTCRQWRGFCQHLASLLSLFLFLSWCIDLWIEFSVPSSQLDLWNSEVYGGCYSIGRVNIWCFKLGVSLSWKLPNRLFFSLSEDAYKTLRMTLDEIVFEGTTIDIQL